MKIACRWKYSNFRLLWQTWNLRCWRKQLNIQFNSDVWSSPLRLSFCSAVNLTIWCVCINLSISHLRWWKCIKHILMRHNCLRVFLCKDLCMLHIRIRHQEKISCIYWKLLRLLSFVLIFSLIFFQRGTNSSLRICLNRKVWYINTISWCVLTTWWCFWVIHRDFPKVEFRLGASRMN